MSVALAAGRQGDVTGRVSAFAPARVNLIGDHTDYTGGLACPMAVDLGTTVTLDPGGDAVRLVSDATGTAADVPLDVADVASVTPPWARYVAGVVALLRPPAGGTGVVASTVPLGAGLSSSASLELAVALALGFAGTPLDLARLGQAAEHLATGTPTGLLDQVASACGRAGHAMVVDFTTLDVDHVPLPDGVEVVVVDSGQRRELATTAYAERRAQCAAAADLIGPLATATEADAESLADPVLRRRARHVVTENARVRAFATALRAGDAVEAGRLMLASHASLATDFEVSVPALDGRVGELRQTPGVYGARMTGGGFGGCVVALTEPGAVRAGWHVRAVAGAARLVP
ncbi:MAG: galactokinase [Frankiaceae bacterium]|nr:galactokinase [Frankiaceae bacterium]